MRYFNGPAAKRPAASVSESDYPSGNGSTQDNCEKGIQKFGEGLRDLGYQGHETSYGLVVKIFQYGRGCRVIVKLARNFYLHVNGASLGKKQINHMRKPKRDKDDK